MALVNMMQSAEEAKENSACCTDDSPDEPRYPYGLELSLDEETLAKLGITAPPAVGTTMMITAKIVVTRASSYQTQGKDPESSSAWQITDLECGSTQASQQSTAAAALYGST
jgi:hypothetical protein